MTATPITPRPVTADEISLETLERDVVKGQQALEARNRLVVKMVGTGRYTQSNITRRLNRQRLLAKAQPLTPDAIFAIIKRSKT